MVKEILYMTIDCRNKCVTYVVPVSIPRHLWEYYNLATARTANTGEPSYNSISLRITLSVVSDILWHQVIPNC